VVVEHLAACAAARTGWTAEGQHIHHLGSVARCRHRDRTWCETGLAIRKRKRGEVKVQDPDASAKKG
jgi:hypothetical protein